MVKKPRKPRYVILSRDSLWGKYRLWTDDAELRLACGACGVWGRHGAAGRALGCLCNKDWHQYTGLVLREGTKRRVKITFLADGRWRNEP